jgi:cytochrome c553
MRYSWLLVLLAPLFAAASASDDEVRANYLLACRGCHLADGSGVPPEIPTLRNTLGPLAASAEGRDYLVRVPAVLQSRLSDEKLTEVLNWVLTEFNADTLPKNFKPLTTREVTAARKQILADPIGYRRARLSGKTSLE